MKKFLSILIVLAMCMTLLPVFSSAEVIYSDDFSTLDKTGWELEKGVNEKSRVDILNEQGSPIVFTYRVNPNGDQAQINVPTYAKKTFTPIGGKVVVEFDAYQTSNYALKTIRILDENGNPVSGIGFDKVQAGANAKPTVNKFTTNDKGTVLPGTYPSNEWCRFQFAFDMDAKKVSVSTSAGDSVANLSLYSGAGAKIGGIEIRTEGLEFGVVKLDNVSVYTGTPNALAAPGTSTGTTGSIGTNGVVSVQVPQNGAQTNTQTNTQTNAPVSQGVLQTIYSNDFTKEQDGATTINGWETNPGYDGSKITVRGESGNRVLSVYRVNPLGDAAKTSVPTYAKTNFTPVDGKVNVDINIANVTNMATKTFNVLNENGQPVANITFEKAAKDQPADIFAMGKNFISKLPSVTYIDVSFRLDTATKTVDIISSTGASVTGAAFLNASGSKIAGVEMRMADTNFGNMYLNTVHVYIPDGGTAAPIEPTTPATTVPTAAPIQHDTVVPMKDSSIVPNFVDMEGHWAKNMVYAMVQTGIVKGVDAQHFAPDRNITRAEFVALITRVLQLSDKEYAGVFTDVSAGDWYAKSLQAAYDDGLINANLINGGAFAPTAPINREEMTVIIMAAYRKYVSQKTIPGNLDIHTDKDQISAWAYEFVEDAYLTGMLHGLTDTTLGVKKFSTRAQAATMVQRLYDSMLNKASMDGIVAGGKYDIYGQFIPAYPYLENVVTSDADLKADIAKETAYVRDTTKYDKYGGILDGQKLESTGFFRTEWVDGKAWFVTPEGNKYFYKAMTTMLPYSYRAISAFEEVPDKNGEFAEAFNGEQYSARVANLIRKFGKDNWRAEWAKEWENRLWNWGYNAIGDWSLRTVNDFDMPHVLTIHLANSTADKIGAKQLPDPFDPALVTFIENQLKTFSGADRNPNLYNDPNLIAYCIGNEMEFNSFGSLKPYLVITNVAQKDANSGAKKDFVQFMSNRYNGNIAEFNKNWNLSMASFDAMLASFAFDGNNGASDACKADMDAYLEHFCDELFKVCTETIRKYDTNHMIWGPRLIFWAPDPVIKSAGKYFDAIAFDWYGYEVFEDKYEHYQELASNKPFLMTEFGFESMDVPYWRPEAERKEGYGSIRLFGALENQTKRGQAYAHYVEKLASMPFFVGFSYFQMVDGELTGVVDNTDRYPQEYVDAMLAANTRLEDIHKGIITDIADVVYPDGIIRDVTKMRYKFPIEGEIANYSGTYPNYPGD